MRWQVINKFQWSIAKKHDKLATDLSLKYNISKICANILINRGILEESRIENFLDPYAFIEQDPFLIFDMDKAVLRIKKAINNNEKVTIYGDYDVDGITSTALLCRFFKSQNLSVSFYIPDRFSEGYGINKNALQKIKDNGNTLVISVDCGITAINEAEFAKEIGLDLIITDHHKCKDEIPKCVAVVNPHYLKSKYSFTEFAGVGVAFKLICAIMKDEVSYHKLLVLYSDIVAVGTIADVMPITDENRIIVTAGLKKISKGKSVCGLKQLLSCSNVESSTISTQNIAFMIAPRLNAAGRVASASVAVELLLTDDITTVNKICEELQASNVLRQNIEKEILNTAISKVSIEVDTKNDFVIVLSHENWHNGIIGIVASRLCNIFSLPTVLISISGNTAKGSARAIGEFDMHDAFCACEEFIDSFGGHKKAAGLTLKTEHIGIFKKAINDYAKQKYTKSELTPKLYIDCELFYNDITIDTINSLQKLEPFGNDNEQPNFLIKKMKINQIIPLTNGKHTKLSLIRGNTSYEGLLFGTETSTLQIKTNDIIDIVCNLDINEFRGNLNIQFKILDYKLSEEV